MLGLWFLFIFTFTSSYMLLDFWQCKTLEWFWGWGYRSVYTQRRKRVHPLFPSTFKSCSIFQSEWSIFTEPNTYDLWIFCMFYTRMKNSMNLWDVPVTVQSEQPRHQVLLHEGITTEMRACTAVEWAGRRNSPEGGGGRWNTVTKEPSYSRARWPSEGQGSLGNQVSLGPGVGPQRGRWEKLTDSDPSAQLLLPWVLSQV